MTYIDATYLENAEDYAEALNDNGADMDQAVDFLTVHGDGEEPEWFDFGCYYDTAPVAGFVDGMAIMLANENDPHRPNEWVAAGRTSRELSTWQK